MSIASSANSKSTGSMLSHAILSYPIPSYPIPSYPILSHPLITVNCSLSSYTVWRTFYDLLLCWVALQEETE
jgi:hypothetical protein